MQNLELFAEEEYVELMRAKMDSEGLGIILIHQVIQVYHVGDLTILHMMTAWVLIWVFLKIPGLEKLLRNPLNIAIGSFGRNLEGFDIWIKSF